MIGPLSSSSSGWVDRILGQFGEQLIGVLPRDERLLQQALRLRGPKLLGPGD